MAEHNSHHITPSTVLVKTMLGLVVLTVLTVLAAQLHLGFFAAPVAFLIATIKAYLVISYFMGMKYDHLHNKIIFASGFFFLAVFLFFSALDVFTRIQVQSTL